MLLVPSVQEPLLVHPSLGTPFFSLPYSSAATGPGSRGPNETCGPTRDQDMRTRKGPAPSELDIIGVPSSSNDPAAAIPAKEKSADAAAPPVSSTTTEPGQTRASRRSQARQGRRTKLSTEERAKVLEVRRQRACLRCKMLKIQCSKENPCKPCLSSAVRGYERKVLSFCYCVRTRFVDVDIFHSAGPGPTPEVPSSVRALLEQIEPPSTAALEENVFEDTLIRWLTNPNNAPPDGSIVAMLCNAVGRSEGLQRAVDADLTTDFRTFLFTTSLAHTGWSGPVAHGDLCVAGHLCGSRIVRRLDRILTPQFLSKCDRSTHRALLLLVFGLILGVGYSARVTTSPSFPHALLGPEMRHSPTLWLAMKEHLAQMLAHHLIFLGSILGIKLDTASEKTIIDSAVNRWHKPEANIWASVVGDALPPKLSPARLLTALQDFNDVNDLVEKQQAVAAAAALLPAGSTTTEPTLASTPTPLVTLACPDIMDLQTLPHLSENPTSYLSITNEEIQGLTPPTTEMDEPQGPEQKDLEGGSPHISKQRSVWVVRPYDGRSDHELVNVFARFRLQPGQNVGLFV